MNKITRKIPSAIFLENYVRNNVDSDLIITPKIFNQSIKNYHTHYDRYIKKKLGKAKYGNISSNSTNM